MQAHMYMLLVLHSVLRSVSTIILTMATQQMKLHAHVLVFLCCLQYTVPTDARSLLMLVRSISLCVRIVGNNVSYRFVCCLFMSVCSRCSVRVQYYSIHIIHILARCKYTTEMQACQYSFWQKFHLSTSTNQFCLIVANCIIGK